MQDFSLFKKSKDISGHSAAVYSIAFDGIYIYSASGDRYVTRWNLQTGIQDKFAIQFKNLILLKEKKLNFLSNIKQVFFQFLKILLKINFIHQMQMEMWQFGIL
ncbi:MAG: hypothetical protein EBZ95_11615 [Chitinophagia bacterium]|nr:hypothetical protein [Chitinophagia bacterium]